VSIEAPRPLAISAEVARRFLVRRHLLDAPRGLPASPASVLAVVERLGSLQFDPLETPGARNHDLVLHARVAGYERPWCDAHLYGASGERKLFEAYNKSLNILPAHELPYYRLTWEHAATRYRPTILAKSSKAAREILGRLRDEGPLTTAAFKSLGTPVDWHGAPTTEGRAVLEALFESGRVGIARRDGSRRTYDLIERLFPPALLTARATTAEAMRHRLLSRFRGVGLLGSPASTEIFHRSGTAKERAAIVAALVAEGALLPAEIEGIRGLRYLLEGELPLLAAARREPAGQGVTFLAPLDPLLWDRRLLRGLFGFDYIWEVYTPEVKRKHGYYVLPILFGDRLVGRIEPRIAKGSGVLQIAGIWFEAGFSPLTEAGFAPGFAAALRAYATFVAAPQPGVRAGAGGAAGAARGGGARERARRRPASCAPSAAPGRQGAAGPGAFQQIVAITRGEQTPLRPGSDASRGEPREGPWEPSVTHHRAPSVLCVAKDQVLETPSRVAEKAAAPISATSGTRA